MATYTMELREVADVMGDQFDAVLLNDYPIFDEGYRPILNRKIIDHFWYREIGQETIDVWVHFINRKMNEVMPLYNQLYESTRIEFDPMLSFDITTLGKNTATTDASAESSTRSDSTNKSTSRAVTSEMPQTMLSGSQDYASSAADTTSEGTGDTTGTETQESTQKASTEHESTTRGRQATAGALLAEWRASMLNVDMLVIAELEPLFMGLWNSPDHRVEPFTPLMPYFLPGYGNIF